MNKTKQIAKNFLKNSDLVEIYCTILNKIPCVINVYLFFPVFSLNFSLLDPDPYSGGKINADPDPQPYKYGFIIHNSNIIVHKKCNRAGHAPKLLLYSRY